MKKNIYSSGLNINLLIYLPNNQILDFSLPRSIRQSVIFSPACVNPKVSSLGFEQIFQQISIIIYPGCIYIGKIISEGDVYKFQLKMEGQIARASYLAFSKLFSWKSWHYSRCGSLQTITILKKMCYRTFMYSHSILSGSFLLEILDFCL